MCPKCGLLVSCLFTLHRLLHMSIHQFVCPFIHLSIYPFVHSSLGWYFGTSYLSVCVSVSAISYSLLDLLSFFVFLCDSLLFRILVPAPLLLKTRLLHVLVWKIPLQRAMFFPQSTLVAGRQDRLGLMGRKKEITNMITIIQIYLVKSYNQPRSGAAVQIEDKNVF